MKVNLDSNPRTNFKAKISQKFLSSARGYLNNGQNKLKNNYILNKKIEEYKNFGYDNYTVELHKKEYAFNSNYALIAVKDGQPSEKGSLLASRNSYKKIYKAFLEMTKGEFNRCVRKNNI